MANTLTKAQLKALGTRLLELREGRGMSAKEVARDALGYANGSHVAVSRLERAIIASPRVEHLLRLAEFYGVEPEHLMVAAPPPTAERQQSTAKSRPARKPVAKEHPQRRVLQKVAAAKPVRRAPRSREDIARFWLNWKPGQY